MICGKGPVSRRLLQHLCLSVDKDFTLQALCLSGYIQNYTKDSHQIWNTVKAQYWFLVLPAINGQVYSGGHSPFVHLNSTRQMLFGQRWLVALKSTLPSSLVIEAL